MNWILSQRKKETIRGHYWDNWQNLNITKDYLIVLCPVKIPDFDNNTL